MRQSFRPDDAPLVVADGIIYDEYVLTVGHGLGYQRGHNVYCVRLRIGQIRHRSEPGFIHRDGNPVHGDGIHLYR